MFSAAPKDLFRKTKGRPDIPGSPTSHMFYHVSSQPVDPSPDSRVPVASVPTSSASHFVHGSFHHIIPLFLIRDFFYHTLSHSVSAESTPFFQQKLIAIFTLKTKCTNKFLDNFELTESMQEFAWHIENQRGKGVIESAKRVIKRLCWLPQDIVAGPKPSIERPGERSRLDDPSDGLDLAALEAVIGYSRCVKSPSRLIGQFEQLRTSMAGIVQMFSESFARHSRLATTQGALYIIEQNILSTVEEFFTSLGFLPKKLGSGMGEDLWETDSEDDVYPKRLRARRRFS